MKNKQFLISLLILLALLGFVASSSFMFYKAFELLDSNGQLPTDYTNGLNPALVYVANGLTGLVGGIVATAFGVNLSNTSVTRTYSIQNRNFQNLGSMVYSGAKNIDPTKGDRNKALYGFLYALSYIIIGVAAVVIWIVLGENTTQMISNTATTFLGMMIPIVATYFKK